MLLELEGLGWTYLETISSQGVAGGWKRRAGLLPSVMPWEEEDWLGTWEKMGQHI